MKKIQQRILQGEMIQYTKKTQKSQVTKTYYNKIQKKNDKTYAPPAPVSKSKADCESCGSSQGGKLRQMLPTVGGKMISWVLASLAIHWTMVVPLGWYPWGIWGWLLKVPSEEYHHHFPQGMLSFTELKCTNAITSTFYQYQTVGTVPLIYCFTTQWTQGMSDYLHSQHWSSLGMPQPSSRPLLEAIDSAPCRVQVST